ncbi:MAG: class B sortase [Bacteroidales bacterium]|nr:class B sortase [Lachnoclostridium sp.]MCM1384105.1 class B sortase [Lachnoclostridium sp.]MCM1465665.1 class B sortase [Bacteroidales bacterium]
MADTTVNTTESIMVSIMENMEKNKQNNQIWKILLGVCLIAAVICGIVLGVRQYAQSKEQKRLEELAAMTTQTEPEPSSEPVQEPPGEPEMPDPFEKLRQMGIPIPEKEVDFEALKEEVNEDIYAWLYIPDSTIDFPVLRHPTDNSYYLLHNLDGSSGRPGCIYTENYNSMDFTDPNTVMYGHNMRVGTMFAGLHNYEDEEFFAEHPYIYVYTPEKLFVYEVFAAYEFSDLHLLLNFDFTSEQVFQKFLDDIYEMRSMNCNTKEDVEVTAKNRILTLSTCVTGKDDKRYLVQGVLLNED